MIEYLTLVKKIEDCHRTAKIMKGERFNFEINFWIDIVRTRMINTRKTVLECAYDIINDFKGDSDDKAILTINILAACYEILENNK